MLTREQEDTIIADYASKMSLAAAGKKSGVSFATARNVIIRRGGRPRPRRRYTMDQSFFERVDSEAKAQILGFYWADGCILDASKKRKGAMDILNVCISAHDRAYLEWMGLQMGSTYPLIDWSRNGRHYVRLAISDPKPISDIQRLGLFPRKSLLIGFPTEAQVPAQFIPAFIRGVFEGDGCIHLKKGDIGSGAVAMVCATLEFNRHLQKILEGLGIRSVVEHPKQANGKNWTRLLITRLDSVFRFADWIYKDASYTMVRKRVLFEQLCARYDDEMNLIVPPEVKAVRTAKLLKVRASWTLTDESRAKMSATHKRGMKRSFVSFYVKASDGVIHYANVISDFAREMELNVGSFYQFVRQRGGAKTYKGWTHPTPDEVESSRQSKTLVTHLYRQPTAPVASIVPIAAPTATTVAA